MKPTKAYTRKGKLTVIAGPMFSGKTGKLVAITEVLTRMGKIVVTIKPEIDMRYGNKREIHSHDHHRTKAIVANGQMPETIIEERLGSQADVASFDEVQFFDREKISQLIKRVRRNGGDVIVAGLLYDYRRRPFGVTGELLGLADERLELFAVCQKCGNFARHSERQKGSNSVIDIGAADKYIAVCESCHRIYR